jgi:very-short-patch-repair endonuclease
MELRAIIWAWETALARALEHEPSLGRALRRSCRPVAAERRNDGRLTLVLGCWWPPDLHRLRQPAEGPRLDAALSEYLGDQVEVLVVPWPGGMAPPAPDPEPADVLPPDLLHGLPRAAREAAGPCESALQRLLFARAWARGVRLTCQHPVLNFRLDFAVPSARVAAEVVGWHGPRADRTARWEREQHLGSEAWRVLYFSGEEVHRDADRCAEQLASAVAARGGQPRGGRPGRPR